MKKRLKACMILTLYLIWNTIFLFSAQTQTKSLEEQQVLDTLERFKKGIEQGNIEIGEQITTLEIDLSFDDPSCRMEVTRSEG